MIIMTVVSFCEIGESSSWLITAFHVFIYRVVSE